MTSTASLEPASDPEHSGNSRLLLVANGNATCCNFCAAALSTSGINPVSKRIEDHKTSDVDLVPNVLC